MQRGTYVPGIAGADVQQVQRRAGGTAVYATLTVLGLDVALPATHPLVLSDIVEAYRWLGEVWIDALAEFGVQAELVSIERARAAKREDTRLRPLIDAVCFGTLSPYEVVVDGRKVVGLAQVRRRAGELLQAGLHLDFDADGLAALMAPENADALARALKERAVGLREMTSSDVSFHDVMAAFERALERHRGVRLQPSTWPQDVVDYATGALESQPL